MTRSFPLPESHDVLEELSARAEREQREFENHWLWRELGSTPREFFAMVDAYVARSGIPAQEWNRKLEHAKKRLGNTVRPGCRQTNRPRQEPFGLKA